MESEMHQGTRARNDSPDRSYPIRADVDYRVMEEDRVLSSEKGRTRTMSSTHVWLEYDKVLRLGVLVELAVMWPVCLDGRVPLKLIIAGRVAQVQGKYAKVEILRHEFRIRPLTRHHQPSGSKSVGRTMTASA